jgi:hypothetical protein
MNKNIIYGLLIVILLCYIYYITPCNDGFQVGIQDRSNKKRKKRKHHNKSKREELEMLENQENLLNTQIQALGRIPPIAPDESGTCSNTPGQLGGKQIKKCPDHKPCCSKYGYCGGLENVDKLYNYRNHYLYRIKNDYEPAVTTAKEILSNAESELATAIVNAKIDEKIDNYCGKDEAAIKCSYSTECPGRKPCCSKLGYCGMGDEYCNKNSIDYCDTNNDCSDTDICLNIQNPNIENNICIKKKQNSMCSNNKAGKNVKGYIKSNDCPEEAPYCVNGPDLNMPGFMPGFCKKLPTEKIVSNNNCKVKCDSRDNGDTPGLLNTCNSHPSGDATKSTPYKERCINSYDPIRNNMCKHSLVYVPSTSFLNDNKFVEHCDSI